MPDALIVICGPTAVGKTAAAIAVAERLGGEIVCADSRTIYRGMDIGTAKPSRDERSHVTHHLIDVVNPDGEFTVARFVELADRANLLLVAPATAHVIAELAHGLAHHPLAAIALATRAPILIAPAMNGKMWLHPATVENVEKLKSRGVEFIGPEEGMLACGYEGLGRLWKVDDIAFRAEFLLARQENLIA